MKEKILTNLHSNPTTRSLLFALSAFSIAFLIDALVLIIPPPISMTRVLSSFHPGLAFLLIVFLGFVFSRKGFAWDSVSLTLTLVLFNIPLIYKWQTAEFNGSMFGGLLPWSDAGGYYEGAHHLIAEGYLTSWATRRPLFGGFLAVLLSITGNNLQITLIVLTILNALAVFLASREIQKLHGSFAAAMFLTVCYWYYCAYAGTVGTEQIGLCFGALGTALLLRGANNGSLKEAASGLFILTVALNARAGAFFILPILALWFGFNFRRKLGWWKPIMAGVAVIVLGMAGNLIMAKTIGPPNAIPFSNYSYTLYGLASGNKGWMQVLVDHPGVKEEAVMGLAIQKIKEHPSLLLEGIFGAYRDFFTISNGAFSFVNSESDVGDLGSYSLWVLTLVGLASALIRYKHGPDSLMVAAFAGILLSAGLVPPIDADSMRAYAATIPFTVYIASTGIVFLEDPLKRIGLSGQEAGDQRRSPNLLPSYAAILLMVCFGGPLLIKIFSHSPVIDVSVACQQGEGEIIFLTGPGSSVNLTPDSSIRDSYLPNIRITDFVKGTQLGPSFYPYVIQELLSLDPGYTISVGTYQRRGEIAGESWQIGYLITNAGPLEPGPHLVCATLSRSEQLREFFFYSISNGDVATTLTPSMLQQNPTLVDRIRSLYGFSIVLIYLFGSLIYLAFPSAMPVKKIVILGIIVLVPMGTIISLNKSTMDSLTWERSTLKPEDMIHNGGNAYEISLEKVGIDPKLLEGATAFRVWEDGTPLKHPDASSFDIKRRGKGRYSLQNGNLIFSASDNTDPQTNGRHYEIIWFTGLGQLLHWARYPLILGIMIFTFVHLRRIIISAQ